MENLALALGIVRIAVGAAGLVAPSLPGAPWVGFYEAKRTSVRLFARTVGGRDLALGLGVLAGFERRSRRQLADLVLLGALADACDALATLAAYKDLPRRTRPLIMVITIAAAIGGGVIGASLHRRR